MKWKIYGSSSIFDISKDKYGQSNDREMKLNFDEFMFYHNLYMENSIDSYYGFLPNNKTNVLFFSITNYYNFLKY